MQRSQPSPPNTRALADLAASAARGVALVVGAVLLFDVARGLAHGRHPGALWLDTRWLPGAAAGLLLALLGAALAASAFAPRWRRFGALAAAGVALHATRDALRVAPLTGWLSCSTVLAMGLTGVALATLTRTDESASGRARRLAPLLAGAALALAGLPLAQIAGSARADYTRHADAVVVLGARVYADGSASLALSDRVRTGAALVEAGYAPTLIVSGGPGDGVFHETDAMRRIAREQGVADGAIVRDRGGLSTADSARNVAALLGEGVGRRRPRVLLVSHDYHLARSRLALDDVGLTALTVPAKQTRPLVKLPAFVAREVAAFWLYYLAR